MNLDDMESTVKALLAPGKGLLAADESFPTIEKRFALINMPSTPETRRDYREMLFTTPRLGEFISGVILFDETIRQRDSKGTPFPDVLRQQGIVPGIKVDKGTTALVNFPGERITAGLDGLADRFAEYRELGARFSKWRAVFSIDASTPSVTATLANAEVLARYAAISQQAGLVPIVEPEVLMTGNHSIDRCKVVTEWVLHGVFDALFAHRVKCEQMLLKPSMVLSGEQASPQASVDEVAEATTGCLRRTVPAAVPGIVFLSGGQDAITATRHLNAINQVAGMPWVLSFSFARALQIPALTTWKGDPSRVETAQHALYHRAKCNSYARRGEYTDVIEHEGEDWRQQAA